MCLSYATEIVKSIPLVGGIANIMDKAIDGAYSEYKDRQFNNTVNTIVCVFSLKNE